MERSESRGRDRSKAVTFSKTEDRIQKGILEDVVEKDEEVYEKEEILR